MKRIIFLIIAFVLITHTAVLAADTGELWVVLPDLSDSMGKGDETPFQRNMEQVQKIINSVPKSAKILIMGFGKRADTVLLRAEFPHISGPGQKNIIAARNASLKKFKENLAVKGKKIDKSKTGIHGALLRVSRLFMEAADSPTKKRLFILSDMLENESFNLNLKRLSADGYEGVVRDNDSNKLSYPDLKDIEIYCYSAFSDNNSDTKDMKTSEIETGIQNLKEFWKSYFSRGGGILKTYKTGIY